MSYQRGLLNVLKILAWVQPPGMTPAHLAERLELSTRSVYRYLVTLEEAGFEMEREEGRYYISGQKRSNLLSRLSREEVGLLRELVNGLPEQHARRYHLLSKLEGHEGTAEAGDGAWMLTAAANARNINRLRQAIAQKRPVILKKYHSLHRGAVRDRRVNPLALDENWVYLHAYDPEKEVVKLFKISRMAEVSILQYTFDLTAIHQVYEPDIFGISGPEAHDTEILLSERAKALMLEEFPPAKDWVSTDPKTKLPVYRGPVRGWEGIGRFLLGLPGEWKVVAPPALQNYLSRQLQRHDKKYN